MLKFLNCPLFSFKKRAITKKNCHKGELVFKNQKHIFHRSQYMYTPIQKQLQDVKNTIWCHGITIYMKMFGEHQS
jgi:hypothetical protein